MRALGITDRCTEIWERGATALVGISPFNSYFDEDRIRRIIQRCSADGREVMIFIPDEVTTHTLEARGYTPAKAARKTRRQVQYLRNKIARAADGCPPPTWDCARLAAEDAYRARHADLKRRFEADAGFRDGCLGTTRWVLSAHPGQEVSQDAALHGVQYLLAELPMFLSAPEVVARTEVAFVYHQCPEFIRDLYRGMYGGSVAEGQAFVELTGCGSIALNL